MSDSAPSSSASAELSRRHRRGCLRNARALVAYLRADLHRYDGRPNFRAFLRHYLFTPGYRYTVVMRTCGYLTTRPLKGFGFQPLFKLLLLRNRYKFGIAIPEYTVIGPGLFINRFGGIFVNGDCVIGANVNITHGVMLGQANRGSRAGSPIIGDRVFLASGAKVVGRVSLGNDVAVGVNAVVTKHVPENAVVVGIPGKVISQEGSEGYVNRKVPDALLRQCAAAQTIDI